MHFNLNKYIIKKTHRIKKNIFFIWYTLSTVAINKTWERSHVENNISVVHTITFADRTDHDFVFQNEIKDFYLKYVWNAMIEI